MIQYSITISIKWRSVTVAAIVIRTDSDYHYFLSLLKF